MKLTTVNLFWVLSLVYITKMFNLEHNGSIYFTHRVLSIF